MTDVVYLRRADVESLLPLEELIPVIRDAFIENARGGSLQFPVVRESIPDTQGIFGIKSGYLKEAKLLGLKAGGFWSQNGPRYGLPGHQSTMLLFNPETGELAAVIEANPITTLRTGAAGAVAAQALARPDSGVAAIIGTGNQAAIQLRGLALTFKLQEARVWGRDPGAGGRFAQGMGELGFPVRPCVTAEAAVRGADIVVTTTPSYTPVVMDEWVSRGTHINAIGSDTRGKQEVQEALFRRASLFVDNLEQARVLGETQHAFGKGIITPEQVKAELGQVLIGAKPGRVDRDDITVFDATGVAFQDLAAAGLAVARHRLGNETRQ